MARCLREVAVRRFTDRSTRTRRLYVMRGRILRPVPAISKNQFGSCGARGRRPLQWIENYGDPDRDGFGEYDRRSANGLVIRVGGIFWRTRSFTQDGGWADGPIALARCRDMSSPQSGTPRVGLPLGRPATSRSVSTSKPSELRQHFEGGRLVEIYDLCSRARWGGNFHAGGCLERRPCPDDGHVAPDRAGQCRRHIARSRLFSGWGIRTVSLSCAPVLNRSRPQRLGMGRTTTR